MQEDSSILARLKSNLTRGFDNQLGVLKRAEEHRQDLAKMQLSTLYDLWAAKFEKTRVQFEGVWDFFATIEKELNFWHKHALPQGKLGRWNAMGLSQYGYSFGCVLVKGEDPKATKWISVSYAHNDASTIGMGDERVFGYEKIPANFLNGFAACHNTNSSDNQDKARALLESVNQFGVTIHLHHKDLGQTKKIITLDMLDTMPLVDMCRGLFMALNDDDLQKLSAFQIEDQGSKIQALPFLVPRQES